MSAFEKSLVQRQNNLIAPSAMRGQLTDKPFPAANPFRVEQQAFGNQTMLRRLQAKLRINQPGDKYEQEADRIANQVMRMPEPQVSRQSCCPDEEREGILQAKPLADHISPLVQRQIDEEEEEILQPKQQPGSAPTVTPNIEAGINSLKGGGQPLDRETRSFMEPRFGHDFSDVRVHTDNKAAELAQAVNSRAFTAGRDMVFGAGQFAPETFAGSRLMAHELAHTIQQGKNRRENTNSLTDGISAAGIQREKKNPDDAADTSVVEINITRDVETDNSTTGTMTVNGHTLYSLELPDRNNAATGNTLTASRIPAGTYYGHVRTDGSRGWRLELENVPGRKYIQIHVGNYPKDSVGCILPGLGRTKDMVTSSVKARNLIREVVEAAGEAVTIKITVEDLPKQEAQKATHCGPEVSDWLVEQMNRNQNHPAIKTVREVTWPRYVPLFNIGWTAGFMMDFANLVKPGGPWDFKRSESFASKDPKGISCPSSVCKRTVTICDICFDYDVPGNIHYGWVGRRAGLRPWVLHFGAGVVQEGALSDDPADSLAIDVGIEMAEKGTALCTLIKKHKGKLRRGPDACIPCSTRYEG